MCGQRLPVEHEVEEGAVAQSAEQIVGPLELDHQDGTGDDLWKRNRTTVRTSSQLDSRGVDQIRLSDIRNGSPCLGFLSGGFGGLI